MRVKKLVSGKVEKGGYRITSETRGFLIKQVENEIHLECVLEEKTSNEEIISLIKLSPIKNVTGQETLDEIQDLKVTVQDIEDTQTGEKLL